jgi:hypothetical protein
LKKLFCLCVSALLVGACSKRNDPVANAQQAAADKDLQHTFATECTATPLRALGTWAQTLGEAKDAGQKISYKFTGVRVTKKTEVYNTNTCEGDANYVMTETGTFTTHKDPNKKTNDGGYPIDLKIERLLVNIVSDKGAASANAQSLCGIKDWAPNKERDVTGKAKDQACSGAQVPRTVANIYKVDNKRLTLGIDAGKDVPDKSRPASLDKTVYNQQ